MDLAHVKTSAYARDITYAQLQGAVLVRFASGLKKLGVGKGVPTCK